MDETKASWRSRILRISIHVVLLFVGIVLGRYLIIATTDPPSDPVAIEYELEFVQSPEGFAESDVLALATVEESDARRVLARKGWRYVMSPTIQASYGSTAAMTYGWLDAPSDRGLSADEDPLVLRSTWKNSRISTQIVVWQGESSISHLVDLALGETRILRIDDCERVGGPSVFVLIKMVAIWPNSKPRYPVLAPAGGTATPAAFESFAPSIRSR